MLECSEACLSQTWPASGQGTLGDDQLQARLRWSFLVLSFLVLLLWIGFEFHQRDFFRCTYCMHMHKVSIMDA